MYMEDQCFLVPAPNWVRDSYQGTITGTVISTYFFSMIFFYPFVI